jgi:hypothetical protein
MDYDTFDKLLDKHFLQNVPKPDEVFSFFRRKLSYEKAEQYHLLQAAKIRCHWPLMSWLYQKIYHIEQAERNRHAYIAEKRCNIPMPKIECPIAVNTV